MSASPENLPSASLEEQIKHAQLAKLNREIKNLSGYSFDTVAKTIIAVLGVLLAVWTFHSGVVKAQLDLVKTNKELAAAGKDVEAAKQQTAEAQRERRLAEEATTKAYEESRKTAEEFKQAYARNQQTLIALNPYQNNLPNAAQAAVTQAIKPLVYVQFAGGVQRALIDGLRTSLKDTGFNAPGAERINKNQVNEIRYFVDSLEEKKRAEQLTLAVNDYLRESGCKINAPLRARLIQGKPSPLEVWLLLNC